MTRTSIRRRTRWRWFRAGSSESLVQLCKALGFIPLQIYSSGWYSMNYTTLQEEVHGIHKISPLEDSQIAVLVYIMMILDDCIYIMTVYIIYTVI